MASARSQPSMYGAKTALVQSAAVTLPASTSTRPPMPLGHQMQSITVVSCDACCRGGQGQAPAYPRTSRSHMWAVVADTPTMATLCIASGPPLCFTASCRGVGWSHVCVCCGGCLVCVSPLTASLDLVLVVPPLALSRWLPTDLPYFTASRRLSTWRE